MIKTKFTTVDDVTDIPMSENAKTIFKKRFALRDENGNPKETIEEAFYRVASHVADGEKNKKLKEEYTFLFYNFMKQKRFIPNSPTWSGSKTALGQLAACFVLPIADDMGKDDDGIFSTLRNAALIQQTGGGNGFSFSRLRPKGDTVKGSNGYASGPVSFLHAYDTAFGQIAQGGVRRGANMAVLRVDHPDIYEFIRSKSEEGKISNFNISVGVTDKFMQAVKSDSDFDLINPRTNEVAKTVKARELMNEIVKYAYKNGEPGVLFLDAANRQNPVPNQYELEATNPCGEQWLGPYENCCLGHVNILESVKDGKIDWNHLKETVILGTRFLDDVVTQNAYVPAVPKLKEAAHKNRRIGLGFMGLADAMYALGIRYGSKESYNFASQVTEFIRYYSMRESIDLAMEKGTFPGIEGSIYDPKDLKWTIPTPLVEHKDSYSRPKLNWNSLYRDLKKYGIRNSTQLTVAPTGTTGTVFDIEGYGCEPVFALAYYRNVYQSAGNQKGLQLTYVSPFFQKKLDEYDMDETQKKEIIEHAINRGTIQDLENIPADLKHTFVVSGDISADEHVWMQAVIQRFVDNSISKTCNFPEDASPEDVEKAYMLAWELGCKGLTVYVTGSRQEVVLETKETKDKKLEESEVVTVSQDVVEAKRPRPLVVVGRTHEITTPFGKAYVTVNRNGATNTAPFEVFVTIGKSGTDSAAFAEALGRLISGWLRSAIHPNKALEEIAYQLQGIGGSSSVGFGANRVSSIPDAISKVLRNELELSQQMKEHGTKLLEATTHESQKTLFEETDAFDSQQEAYVDATKSFGLKNTSVCPECSNMTLIETEGCVKCQNCGYSRC